ncbi:universal stress protein [Stakelama marina]|uniref:Universal stress protein n=1 Tax=Stakelama marina TaxID=2826939 RepID=A0A8T4IHY9_9SPHN|nr:universal stress protein [Stakelama marina]MBR0552705.1 universal stress protein [Stakelama marina]
MFEKIVVGSDGSKPALAAVRWAGEIASRMGSDIVLVHAFETDPTTIPGGYVVISDNELQNLRAATQDKLDGQWCEPLRDIGVKFVTRLVSGRPAKVIIDVAQEEGATLIVVGNRGRGGFSNLLLGSAGNQLIHHSPIPVTIVPNG